jgi:hypothetical protein
MATLPRQCGANVASPLAARQAAPTDFPPYGSGSFPREPLTPGLSQPSAHSGFLLR